MLQVWRDSRKGVIEWGRGSISLFIPISRKMKGFRVMCRTNLALSCKCTLKDLSMRKHGNGVTDLGAERSEDVKEEVRIYIVCRQVQFIDPNWPFGFPNITFYCLALKRLKEYIVLSKVSSQDKSTEWNYLAWNQLGEGGRGGVNGERREWRREGGVLQWQVCQVTLSTEHEKGCYLF